MTIKKCDHCKNSKKKKNLELSSANKRFIAHEPSFCRALNEVPQSVRSFLIVGELE